jgi:thiol-disulfide isomerase/thioredoxin
MRPGSGITLVWLLIAAGALASVRADDFRPEWLRASNDASVRVQLYFFWSLNCPHCLDARPWIERIAQEHPWIELHSLEITGHPANRRLYQQYAAHFGQTARSVPAFFTCNAMIIGWDGLHGVGRQLLERAGQCRDGQLPLESGQPTSTSPELALLEGIDLAHWNLPLTTLVLAGLDAFNPCAFFILLFLLSLLAHARSRRRMLLVGLIFVGLSGLIYFLFMAAWLNLFLVLGSLSWLTGIAGSLALVIGILNTREYFFFQQGPGLSIPAAARPGLFRRMTSLMATQSLPALLAGTVALALTVNLYELLCTAGFPMVYTRLLTLRQLPEPLYYSYLALYNLVYVAPLLAIVLLFTRTLGPRKLSRDEGRLLKLVSGLMMLMLGLVLLIDPAWLNRLSSSLILLLGVGVACLAIRALDRRRGDRGSPS